MTCSAPSSRPLRGFSMMKSRAVFRVAPPGPPPVNPVTLSTPGSLRTMSTTSPSFRSIAWKDTSWAAWIDPERRPVSCWGKNPFGTTTRR